MYILVALSTNSTGLFEFLQEIFEKSPNAPTDFIAHLKTPLRARLIFPCNKYGRNEKAFYHFTSMSNRCVTWVLAWYGVSHDENQMAHATLLIKLTLLIIHPGKFAWRHLILTTHVKVDALSLCIKSRSIKIDWKFWTPLFYTLLIKFIE